MASKKKSAKPNPTEQPARPSLPARILGLIFQPDLLLTASIVVTCGVLAPAAARWVPDLSQRDEYKLRFADVSLPPQPDWLPEDFVARTLLKGGLEEHTSVLDSELAPRIASAFKKNPWIRGSVEVSIHVPARADVRLQYRQPVAMVQLSDGLYPVDLDAVVLPTREFPREQVGRYPLIKGITTPSSNGLGQEWDDARVLAGARLAVLLAPFWDEWKLASIDAPSRTKTSQKYEELEFAIHTRGGTVIHWGRPPENKHPLEVTDTQKIGRLKEFVARMGSFDDGPWEININNLKDVVYHPLKTNHPPAAPTAGSIQRQNRTRTSGTR